MDYLLFLGVSLLISIAFNIFIFLQNNKLLKINDDLINTCELCFSNSKKMQKISEELVLALEKEVSKNRGTSDSYEESDDDKLLH